MIVIDSRLIPQGISLKSSKKGISIAHCSCHHLSIPNELQYEILCER